MALGTVLLGTAAQVNPGATPIPVPYPAGLTSSHIMILTVANNHATNPATLPAGWTQVYRSTNTGGTLAPGLLVAIKQATGSESGNLNVTQNTVRARAQIIAVDGVNLTTPQDVAATSVDDTSAGADIDIPTATPTRPGCLLVYAACHNNGGATATVPPSPAGFVETLDNPSAGWAGTMGYNVYNSVTATGTVTVTWTDSSKGQGVLLVLRVAELTATTGLSVAIVNTRTATADVNRGAEAALAVTATLAAAATVNNSASAATSVTVSTASAVFVERLALSDISVTSSLAADAVRGTSVDTSFTATVTLAQTANYATGGGNSTTTGASITADATLNRGGAADISVSATIAATATVTRSADATVSVTASPVASGAASRPAAADVTVTEVATAVASVERPAVSDIIVTEVTTVAASVERPAVSAVTVTEVTVAGAAVERPAASAVTETAVITASASLSQFADADVLVNAVIIPDVLDSNLGAAAVSESAVITAAATSSLGASSALTVTAGVTADATLTSCGAASITETVVTTADAIRGRNAGTFPVVVNVDITADVARGTAKVMDADISVTAQRSTVAAADRLASSTLSVGAARLGTANIQHFAQAALTVTTSIDAHVGQGFSCAAHFVLTAVTQSFADAIEGLAGGIKLHGTYHLVKKNIGGIWVTTVVRTYDGSDWVAH